MPGLFLDTSGLIGLNYQGDAHHRRAVAFWETLTEEWNLHVSHDVVDECFTRLRRLAGLVPALRATRSLMAGHPFILHPSDEPLLAGALEIIQRHPYLGLSLTDATSVVHMKRLHLNLVFSFDEHFKKMGLILKP